MLRLFLKILFVVGTCARIFSGDPEQGSRRGVVPPARPSNLLESEISHLQKLFGELEQQLADAQSLEQESADELPKLKNE